jgi:hypothetical protein
MIALHWGLSRGFGTKGHGGLSEERYCADAGASAADVEIMLDHGKHLHVDDSYLWCCTPRTPEAYNRLLLSTLHADS